MILLVLNLESFNFTGVCFMFPFQPGTFPYKEDIMSTNNMCLVLAVLLFIGGILCFKVNLVCFTHLLMVSIALTGFI